MRIIPFCLAFAALFLPFFSPVPATATQGTNRREHLVFFQGTPQELEVYKIHGRTNGPTVMLLGGIHGDEPGAYLSADLFVDLALKKGTLIVVPRANFKSVIHHHRGAGGDMNRKFDSINEKDPEHASVAVLKSLIAESDLLVTMHDGSGFYRPTWESDIANPKRYGQCIIADADTYKHLPTGRTVNLEKMANTAVERINREIATPLHKFRFFNMRTADADSPYKEHRMSATYYALTRIGIPAFCIETSKQLPTLGMKVRQHNTAVAAFLDLFGLERELPLGPTAPPALSHVVITVNGTLPIAAADGNTLMVAPGDTVEVVHIRTNYERGVTAEIEGLSETNGLNKVVTIQKPTTVVVRKDNTVLGRVHIALLPEGNRSSSPKLSGNTKIRQSLSAKTATLDMLPGTLLVAAAEEARKPKTPPATLPTTTGGIAVASTSSSTNRDGSTAPPGAPGRPTAQSAGTGTAVHSANPSMGTAPQPSAKRPVPQNGVAGFLIEVNGKPTEIAPGETLTVMAGSRVKILDIETDGTVLPNDVVMNLRGFIAEKGTNTGEDRGGTVNVNDLLPAFSIDRKGDIYPINAERGKQILAGCALRVVSLQLASITVRFEGKAMTLNAGSRIKIPIGASVEVLDVALKGGITLQNPRFTLAGRPFPAQLPQTLTMRDIAINLAVFEGDALAGKVTWMPTQ